MGGIDREMGRGRFLHSESGCCFEWDQTGGILFQYTEGPDAVIGPPGKLPVWCLEYPDKNTWIWEQIPVPPTDPAAQEQEQPDASDDSDGSHVAAASSSSSEAMPPPPGPPAKRARPAVPAFASANVEADGSMAPPAALPVKKKKKEEESFCSTKVAPQ